jgi:hypothetical protein
MNFVPELVLKGILQAALRHESSRVNGQVSLCLLKSRKFQWGIITYYSNKHLPTIGCIMIYICFFPERHGIPQLMAILPR